MDEKTKLGHGADVVSMALKYGKNEHNIIDFSSNINPYIPKNIDKYILDSIRNCKNYPDVEYISLRKDIGNYLNINYEYIIPGNGATEIIYLIMKALNGPLAIINPTFSEYERSAKLNNIEIVDLYFDRNFKLDINSIKNKIDEFKALFICNPNNPTGNIDDITEVLDLMKKHNKLLIVDETFMEFVHNQSKYTLLSFINEYKNLFIIKAITKFFGLPGIRLGYGVTSNKEILNTLWKFKEPWTVNTFAENICKYIFNDKDYIQMTRNYFKEEIDFMMNKLSKINNILVYNTQTDFILLKLLKHNSSYVKEKLFLENNILIRDASNFKGLDESYIRIAIKDRKNNEIILDALKKVLGE
ncbi:pyridoxal phosphate-dependent aminotransferase [Alkalithermobacter paradoxus]|uniref:Threonine-phosphate decarboxylase n=1 Tax=Alkalithermobacter paradoxus TaxID=29349 RepID=A0A1V4I7U9_9FIRM|nr:threonine-phosphate decarboxylase [[Clostridium] thermoalcaliphilum]